MNYFSWTHHKIEILGTNHHFKSEEKSEYRKSQLRIAYQDQKLLELWAGKYSNDTFGKLFEAEYILVWA